MADIFVDESKLYTLNMELSKYVVFKIEIEKSID